MGLAMVNHVLFPYFWSRNQSLATYKYIYAPPIISLDLLSFLKMLLDLLIMFVLCCVLTIARL